VSLFSYDTGSYLTCARTPLNRLKRDVSLGAQALILQFHECMLRWAFVAFFPDLDVKQRHCGLNGNLIASP